MSTALITGPTAGIGREFALQLAAAGHDLILVARNVDRLEELATELQLNTRSECEVIPADLADLDQVRKVEERIKDRNRPVDWLVNNAGFGLGKSFLNTTVEDEQKVIDVMVTAPMRLTHAALPGMLERGHGRIIVVSSLAGWMTRGTYSAAKAWATVFVEGLEVELKDTGVNATALCPGLVHTEFHERGGLDMSKAPEQMWLDADDVVATAIKDVEKGRVLSVPGRQYQALAHVWRVAPRSVVRRVGAKREG